MISGRVNTAAIMAVCLVMTVSLVKMVCLAKAVCLVKMVCLAKAVCLVKTVNPLSRQFVHSHDSLSIVMTVCP